MLIVHVDMDAFYASVEQRDDPDLRGRPVIVGGTGPRGVVAAASYEVREYGVHSAMPMRRALARCPDAVCVRPRMAHYREVSEQIFEVFAQFTPLVEGLSLDEAFLDVTASARLFDSPEQLGMQIKQRILERTALTASVGIGPNKLVAKIASDLDKPDGLCVVASGQVNAVLDPLPVRRIAGIGPKTAARLRRIGIETIGELREAGENRLRPVFGRYTRRMQQRAAGIDDRAVVADGERKSISTEETFDSDIDDPARLRVLALQMADKVATALRRKELLAGVVTVKIRTSDFVTRTRQRAFAPPGNETGVIRRLAAALLEEWLAAHEGARLRLLGVGVSQLAPARQLGLFGDHRGSDGGIDAVVDRVRSRFGDGSLSRGGPED